MSYISIKNFAQLAKLTESDVIDMMMSGKNFLDGSIITFVSQIEGFEQEIMHSQVSLQVFREKIQEDSFAIIDEDGVTTVESKDFAPSMFFAQKDWEEQLSLHSNVDESYSLLVPHRLNGKLYISDEKIIMRLSDTFEGIYDILTIEDVKTLKL